MLLSLSNSGFSFFIGNRIFEETHLGVMWIYGYNELVKIRQARY